MLKNISLLLTVLAISGLPVMAQSAGSDCVVRYTSGHHRVSGWETDLVKQNPNLGHFIWASKDGIDQGYVRVPRSSSPRISASKDAVDRGYVPRHAPMPTRPSGPIYKSPIHLPLDAFIPPEARKPPVLIRQSNPPFISMRTPPKLPPSTTSHHVNEAPARYSGVDTNAVLTRGVCSVPESVATQAVSGTLLNRRQ